MVFTVCYNAVISAFGFKTVVKKREFYMARYDEVVFIIYTLSRVKPADSFR